MAAERVDAVGQLGEGDRVAGRFAGGGEVDDIHVGKILDPDHFDAAVGEVLIIV